MIKLRLIRFDSPLGELLLVTDEERRVRALEFADHKTRLRRLLSEHYEVFDLAANDADEMEQGYVQKLVKYFDGSLAALEDIPVSTHGSPFQEKVWAALKGIPAGEVVTYGHMARALGHTDPRMAQDVGAAVGANPVAIIVACHRVIGANGDLKGYAGGRHRKEWLLNHEKADIPPPRKRSKTSQTKSAASLTATLPGF